MQEGSQEASRSSAKELKYLSWCMEGSRIFSTCGKRNYMAIIVDRHGRVIGSGYNGGPSGSKHCKDGGCPRFQENGPPTSDYSNCIALHAEQNALLYTDWTLRQGGTLFVNGTPCLECSRLIVGSGLSCVIGIAEPGYRPSGLQEEMIRDSGIVMRLRDLSEIEGDANERYRVAEE